MPGFRLSFLYIKGFKYARNFILLAIGLYMLVYLGIIKRENMQIEGFWYYLLGGTFTAAVLHYGVAKIFGLIIWPGLVRLCLLDSDDIRFTPL